MTKNETGGKAVISLLAMFLFLFSVEANGTDQWEMEQSWGGPASFTKDHNVKHRGGFSRRIQNDGYVVAVSKKIFKVEKHTIYRVSVMARCEEVELNPIDRGGHEGASVRVGTLDKAMQISEAHKGSDWKKIEMEFNSKDRTEIEIALQNGFFRSY